MDSKEKTPKEKTPKEKTCKVCGSKEVVTRKSRTYNYCEKHYQEFVDFQIKKNKEKLLRETGFDNPMKNPIHKATYKASLAKLGVENISQLKNSRAKALKTFKENFNTEEKREELKRRRNETRNKKDNNAINATRARTCLERYGVPNIAQLQEVSLKKQETNLRKTGFIFPMQSPEVQAKSVVTCLNTRGVKNVSQDPEIIKEIQSTFVKNYGFTSPWKNKEFVEKYKQLNLERTGYTTNLQDPVCRKKAETTRKKNRWNLFLLQLEKKQIKPQFDLDIFCNEQEFTYLCEKCGKTFLSSGTNSQEVFCQCNMHKSSYEYELSNWLKSIGVNNIIENYRPLHNNRRLEIDVYLPKYNLGIEIHGLYWHSNIYVDSNYHKTKYLHFKEQGITLVQIFENEWLNSKDIVQSIILNKLKLNKKLYARKCVVKEVNSADCSNFLELNHIQGNVNANIRLGLYNEDTLVSVMTFGQSRFNTKEIELLRFCNICNHSVIGGFQKLLKTYINKYDDAKLSLVSFCDLRYFNGAGYLNCGFQLVSISNPNYFYFKQSTYRLHNRIEFQKHKLKDKLKVYDGNLSEYENMLNNNYLRIFDAGNLKLQYS